MISTSGLALVFYTPSVVYGPLRIILCVLFIATLNSLVSLKTSSQTGLQYFIPRYIAFIGTLAILGFILVQINAYDSFVFICIVTLFYIFKLMNLNFKRPLKPQFQKIRRRFILYTIRNFEQDKKLINSINFKKPLQKEDAFSSKVTGNLYFWQVGIAIGIGMLTYLSRYSFFNFDTYALSDLWYENFGKIKNLTNQQWLIDESSLLGEYVVIQMYAAITGISDVIALQTFGLLENAILGVVIFWTVSKMTSIYQFVHGVLAAFGFIVLYSFLPLNINLMTQHKPIFLALSLALPAMVFLCLPRVLRVKLKSYFQWMLMVFIGISLIDLFVMVIVMPLIFLSTLITISAATKKYYARAFLAYLIALVVFIAIYTIGASLNSTSLLQFVQENLYAFNTYTYAPQLIMPIEELMAIYRIAAMILVLSSLALCFKNYTKYKYLCVIFLLFFSVVYIPLLDIVFIDVDLLYQVISVVLPLAFGAAFYLLFTFVKMIFPAFRVPIAGGLIMAFVGIVDAYFVFQQSALQGIPDRNLTNEHIMEAYDYLDAELLPYSYTVVNTAFTSEMSKGSHYFMAYENFNRTYLAADSIYNANKKNIEFLQLNPNATLSKSIFLFIYYDQPEVTTGNKLDPEQQHQALSLVNTLRAKGRNVEIYIQKPTLMVYEIINEPKATKINDLLF